MLAHAGDLSEACTRQQIQRTLDFKFFKDLPHYKKVVIAGDQELQLDSGKALSG